MAGKIKDYLPVPVSGATADYWATQFDVTPHDIMFETGSFKQRAIRYDDRSVQVVTKSTQPEFFFRLQWINLTETDADKIFDFYFDAAKGKGIARTFEFPHPTEGIDYIVRFWSDIERSIRIWRGFREITLKIEGYMPEESV